MADSYDPYERKREIKQLEKSYMVLRDRRIKNPNPTPKMWVYLEMLYYYKLRDAQNCRYVVGNRRLHYRQRSWRLFLHNNSLAGLWALSSLLNIFLLVSKNNSWVDVEDKD